MRVKRISIYRFLLNDARTAIVSTTCSVLSCNRTSLIDRLGSASSPEAQVACFSIDFGKTELFTSDISSRLRGQDKFFPLIVNAPYYDIFFVVND